MVVAYADYRMTWHNTGSRYNGLGCIPDVIRGKSLQPMQYRVLVPWLVYLMGGMTKSILKPYIVLRLFSILFALSMSYLWFGNILYTAMLALFFIGASIFDYTDGYLEVGFFALSFYLMREQTTWGVGLILAIVFIATLNRETAVFIPICAFLSGHWFVSIGMMIAFMAGYIIPRAYYGEKERYCKFNMIRENIRRMREGIMRNEYILFLVLLGLVIYGYTNNVSSLSGVELGMGIMFIVLLIPTVWCEIRVFKPVMLTLIPMLMK